MVIGTRPAIGLMALLALLATAPANASRIAFSTFLGGTGHDHGHKIALAPDGGIVIVGSTRSLDFPTERALQDERSGKRAQNNQDAFIVKFSPSGQKIEWSTYLGGSQADIALAVDVDTEGNVYVAGETYSPDFPADGTLGDFESQAFLTKVSPDGQEILYSALLGGDNYDQISGLAHEAEGRIFIAGWTYSSEFLGQEEPPGAIGTAFVASIDTEGSRVVSAIRFGSDAEWPAHLVWDEKRRSLWFGGTTSSSDFPLLRPLREVSGPVVGSDGTPAGFLVRLQPTGQSLRIKSASILPGQLEGLAVDRKGRVHLTYAAPSPAEGVKPHQISGWEDMAGRCGYSYYFRLQPNGRGLQNVQCLPVRTTEIAVDRRRRIVIAGESRLGVPITDSLQETAPNSEDLYVAVLSKGAVRLLFSTSLGGRFSDFIGQDGYSGGLAIPRSGSRLLLTGTTDSRDYPTASALQPSKPGSGRRPAAFVTEIRPFD